MPIPSGTPSEPHAQLQQHSYARLGGGKGSARGWVWHPLATAGAKLWGTPQEARVRKAKSLRFGVIPFTGYACRM